MKNSRSISKDPSCPLIEEPDKEVKTWDSDRMAAGQGELSFSPDYNKIHMSTQDMNVLDFDESGANDIPREKQHDFDP